MCRRPPSHLEGAPPIMSPEKISTWILSLSLLSSCASGLPANAAPRTYSSEGVRLQVEILTEQSDIIWGFDFLDENRILFTERDGALKILSLSDKKVIPVTGAPKVYANGQGGLLDVRVSPTNREQIYLTYAEPVGNENTTTAVGVGTLKGSTLQSFKKLFSAHAPNDETLHFGSRIEFDSEGHIFFAVGDRNDRKKVQDLAFHNGKLHRLKADGSLPTENPFQKSKGAQPEIWSIGHRSPQGLVRDPKTGDLWLAEMGPRGGDELNLIEPGKNYGWPEVTDGKEYSGFPLGVKEKPGVTLPVASWVPSISPSGIAIYRGKKFPKWDGNLFVACLSGLHIRRLEMKDRKVVKQEELFRDLNYRFRNVRVGPDENLYFSTDRGVIARVRKAE